MANVVEGEPRNSQEWAGRFMDEGSIVADILKRVTADAEAVKRWMDPWSWKIPAAWGQKFYPLPFSKPVEKPPEHAGCLAFAGMSIRNFYGLWHADNPHTAKGTDEDLEIKDGIVTDARHPDNMSGRIIDAVKAELKKLFPEPARHEVLHADHLP